jgi:hypothetical protein
MACSARRFIRDMRRVLLGSVSTRVYTETPRAGRVEVCRLHISMREGERYNRTVEGSYLYTAVRIAYRIRPSTSTESDSRHIDMTVCRV